MYISWSQLHRLPVRTVSGQKIGTIEGVSLKIESHAVQSYEVKPAKILAALFSPTLLISPGQVLSLSADEMIVKDSVMTAIPETGNKKTRLAIVSPGREMDMRERDS